MEMVGIMATAGGLREQAVAHLNDAKVQNDTSVKTDMLKRVKEIILYRDPSLLSEFVPHLMELQSEHSGPIRKYLAEIIEEIGLKHPEYIPLMVPVLLALLRDDTPAVARRAISTGSNLFRNTLEQVALQGIYSGHVEKRLEESWLWMTSLKDAIYPAAQQHRNDAVRLLAIKFVETAILLFTPDPNGPSQPPPPQQNADGRVFNIAWIVGGHPVLDAGRLGQEASRNLALLLDQLRAPEISKLPGPVAIVLVNSLASIAKRRPSLYGRVLPVLLGLGPNCETMKGAQLESVVHALRNAFLSLLKCTHSGAAPWRDRLITALRAMNAGDAAEAAVRQTDRMLRNAEKERAFRDSRLTKDERPQNTLFVDRKRPPQENGNLSSDMDDSSGKRFRTTPTAVLAGSPHHLQGGSGSQGSGPSGESFGVTLDSELSPLQQMIAMIGALVAKGERAAASIELLITSLPADMLADVVIENMKNLPSTAPPIPSGVNTASSNSAGSLNPPASSTPDVAVPSQTASDHRRDPRRDPRRMDPRLVAVPVGVPQSSLGASSITVKTEEPIIELPSNFAPSLVVKEEGFTALNTRESRQIEESSCIPGISEAPSSQETLNICKEPVTYDVTTQFATDLGATPPKNIAITLSTMAVTSSVPVTSDPSSQDETNDSAGPPEAMDITEDLPAASVSSELAVLATSGPESSKEVQGLSTGIVAAPGATLQGFSTAMPVVYLDADQQTALCKMALIRILESYKLVAPAGGSELRISLLARLIAQSDGDDDALNVLQKHILADYQNNKGHELAIHTLYQLYAEKITHEDPLDAVSVSSTVYDKFLIAIAQGLRDMLPPSDKSLSRLFGEAPLLPEAALQLLESLCNPAAGNKEAFEPSNADRITQGLSAVWSLILLRPPIRGKCLDIALQCAVHELDDVRTKAIRLVANKLYPLSYVSQSIEEFATKMLHSVVEMGDGPKVLQDNEASSHEPRTIKAEEEGLDLETTMNDEQHGADGSILEEDQHKAIGSTVSVQEAQRCMSLYFALCTKKNSLLGQIFRVYENAPKGVRQAVHRHLRVLIRTIGSSSSELLRIISDPPIGSKNLVVLVLHILTDSTTPSSELIAAVKQLYESKLKDARLLIPILSSLSKEEVLPIFPSLVALPSEDFKVALDRILQGSVHTGPALTPAEVLIAIHGIEDHVPLPMVKDACAVCFQQRTVFTQQVLAKVLNQLVEQTPLPKLFMRTVIQAVGSFRSLVSFVMEILSRLVSKQIWKSPNLWVGFLKCADQTQPHSFHVLLQLPAVQLEKALLKHPNLRAPLTAHASKPSVRSTLPRSILVVLGLAQEMSSADPAAAAQSLPSVPSTSVTVAEPQVSDPAATA